MIDQRWRCKGSWVLGRTADPVGPGGLELSCRLSAHPLWSSARPDGAPNSVAVCLGGARPDGAPVSVAVPLGGARPDGAPISVTVCLGGARPDGAPNSVAVCPGGARPDGASISSGEGARPMETLYLELGISHTWFSVANSEDALDSVVMV
ncbi:breast cancer anti-estrogen resistance protein 3-like [Platysternon megacephalum]|uniref:Breast cancer anti-estrogen resistance protein 3-like n=1 Tax=Platysternon megacephalum TaxID=55544 RepID=A0A4D9DUV9_9SAUR|nr:breast cancer anti-estrogen resistance protein 3-like [Platysternon megacephalum]